MVGTRPPREDGAVWTSVQRLRGRWSDYWHPKAVLSTATMQDLRIFRFFQRRPFKQQRLLFMPELSATHRHPSSLQTTPSNTSKALFRFLSCIQPRCHDRHVPSTRRPRVVHTEADAFVGIRSEASTDWKSFRLEAITSHFHLLGIETCTCISWQRSRSFIC